MKKHASKNSILEKIYHILLRFILKLRGVAFGPCFAFFLSAWIKYRKEIAHYFRGETVNVELLIDRVATRRIFYAKCYLAANVLQIYERERIILIAKNAGIGRCLGQSIQNL